MGIPTKRLDKSEQSTGRIINISPILQGIINITIKSLSFLIYIKLLLLSSLLIRPLDWSVVLYQMSKQHGKRCKLAALYKTGCSVLTAHVVQYGVRININRTSSGITKPLAAFFRPKNRTCIVFPDFPTLGEGKLEASGHYLHGSESPHHLHHLLRQPEQGQRLHEPVLQA